MEKIVNICWFRRDLRLKDHAALYHALKDGIPVLPLFIFDRNILDQLEDREDRRVEFIHAALTDMQEILIKAGSTLEVYVGTPGQVFGDLFSRYKVGKVFTNRDYEPYARRRDEEIARLAEKHGATFHGYKDQVIFDKEEVMKDDGSPYTVFTPYSRKWKAALTDFYLRSYPVEKYFRHFFTQSPRRLPTLESMGFSAVDKPFPAKMLRAEVLRNYKDQRDFPGVEGTSRLGVHLRFGTISIRELTAKAGRVNEIFLNELIWRDFYQMILWHFPRVGEGASFKPEYDWIEWRNDEQEFEKWRTGMTGYPIVDAGIRELNATGFMHNRVRMVVASFLARHLLIDWRWGEAWFARKLLDFDLAANNGGWQWAAGCGCDAAPYFRVFNPYLQAQKFDPDLRYIRRWVPELDDPGYPRPMVDHEMARKRALEVYKKALKKL